MKIKLTNVVKAYNDKTVIDGLSYEFSSEKPVVIMGESGIGKTTLLRIILGLETADSGDLTYEGVSREGLRFAPVFQDTRLIGSLDAEANVKLAAHGVSEDVIREHLKSLIPESELQKKVRDLSGGTARRVEIVRAVLAPSDVLIMDEPLTGLDEDNAAKVVDYIHKNIGERLFITSSHSDLFESFCTKLSL
jgi:NitT/TauT family transport system ATP-binding protein